MASLSQQYISLNSPEENDETRSEEFESGLLPELHNNKNHPTTFSRTSEECHMIHQHDAVSHNPLPHHLFAKHAHQTPYPSWEESKKANPDIWQHSSYSLVHRSGSPHSLPSCIYQTLSDGGSFYPSRPHSLPGSCSPSLTSLEQPRSLHSIPPSAHLHPHLSPSYPGPYHHPPCSSQYGPPQHHAAPVHHCSSRPGHHLPYRHSGPAHYRQVDTGFSEDSYASPKPKQASPGITYLSQEQRKVFVTYEADNEAHLKEVIKFVALLRNNGFDTHIDVFEQQLNSISKIDCMERYLNEKDYLIIIIISLRYYETITGIKMNMDNDERTTDTVYIHKQLQSEFIQNGCRNYRFIPILFPGAKKSYVPTWLQNTHIYSWPRDRDDILRRLMRVEKYNPPPVGPLPTIVSIPL
ncbi:E3 ubiquitin ligase TRAF3IP2 isoform X1 [Xyrauchen texanus]|uniref:E3 ubiquitin ligase TRAF3IP2 isoform X1 n=1 Tax=Xyrauchen texanus TaxID=154827 RepID=UPI0022419893|nr:E3 ubiquitin ligase TRAF3IP2 isoform X1 [Xyrauchen texanus]XP_051957748.1 E3 ubiquitin ligase TRAF3IP2 isoform X1 [Xyrauchen texanus]